MSVVDSFDVDMTADDKDDNLYKDNIHNNFEFHKVIQFVDNYDIHALLQYVFVRWRYVDDEYGRI
jgi:hypothetical protein